VQSLDSEQLCCEHENSEGWSPFSSSASYDTSYSDKKHISKASYATWPGLSILIGRHRYNNETTSPSIAQAIATIYPYLVNKVLASACHMDIILLHFGFDLTVTSGSYV
jgi:hypothetical protein